MVLFPPVTPPAVLVVAFNAPDVLAAAEPLMEEVILTLGKEPFTPDPKGDAIPFADEDQVLTPPPLIDVAAVGPAPMTDGVQVVKQH